MCIDICPVGALTSGAYRYKTRPWEMNHVGTVCTHCGDGCKTTLGVRRANDGMEIVRGDNRDKSGINGDFLCIKGRYAFDFANHADRLTQPLVRQPDGKFEPVTWDEAIEFAGKRLREIRDARGGSAIGVIGSNRTTNEENYLLQKFARTVLGTNNIDHHRTADYPAFAAALNGKAEASLRDIAAAKAVLLLGNDPTEQHPQPRLADSHRGPPPRPASLRREPPGHQAPPPGNVIPAHPRRRLRRSDRIPGRRRQSP